MAGAQAIPQFYNARLGEEIFKTATEHHGSRPDYVIDAIDSVTPKCHLLAYCRENGIRIITSTGSGGRLDPTRIRTVDLGRTTGDPLARAIRRILRDQHGFPLEGDFGIPAIVSDEPSREHMELHYDQGKGFRCVCPQGQN